MPSRNLPPDAYRALFENSMDAVLLTIPDGRIVAANEAACEMFGMTESEICAAGRDGLVDTADPRHSAYFKERKREGKARGELQYRRKDGSKFIGDVSSVILNAGQNAFVMIRDVTEKKQAEEALRLSEQRFHLVNQATNDVIWDWDLTDDKILWTGAVREAFGYTEDELPPSLDAWKEHVHAEDRDRVVEGMHAAIIGVTDKWSDEYRFLRKEGSYSTFLDRGFIVRDRYGKAVRATGSMLDISDRKRLEADRDRLTSELEAIIQALPEGLVLYGPEGEIVRLNPAAETFLGFSLESAEFKQQSFAQRNHRRWKTENGEPVPVERLPVARALRGEIVQMETLMYTASDGRSIWLYISAAPIYAARGRLQGAVAAYLDISPLRQLQEEREGYLHTITHDLRTPLTVIQGHAEMLESEIEKVDLGEIPRINIDSIQVACRQMTGMMEDLAEMASLEGGRLTLQPETISIERFVADYLRRSQVAMDVSRVIADIPADLPAAWADPRSLERCLGNLVTNALKYSEEGSPVRLTAGQKGDEVLISIEDKGHGIFPEDLPHIFDRFFRARNTTKQGLGLGLFITRSLVEAQGGRISAESRPGYGSTFHFSLPVAAECVQQGAGGIDGERDRC